MRYGNVRAGLGTYPEDLESLNSLKDSGEISEDEYKTRLHKLKRQAMNYIIATNGGRTPKSQKVRKISELRDRHFATRRKSILKDVEQELESEVSAVDELTSEKVIDESEVESTEVPDYKTIQNPPQHNPDDLRTSESE